MCCVTAVPSKPMRKTLPRVLRHIDCQKNMQSRVFLPSPPLTSCGRARLSARVGCPCSWLRVAAQVCLGVVYSQRMKLACRGRFAVPFVANSLWSVVFPLLFFFGLGVSSASGLQGWRSPLLRSLFPAVSHRSCQGGQSEIWAQRLPPVPSESLTVSVFSAQHHHMFHHQTHKCAEKSTRTIAVCRRNRRQEIGISSQKYR